ncbi:MAG TPA: hypothetical protein VFS68_11830, partial [Candidatus Udaeobacter sp.]|nr:hypothetical protein [Candidatus Udaeobacter sp.]
GSGKLTRIRIECGNLCHSTTSLAIPTKSDGVDVVYQPLTATVKRSASRIRIAIKAVYRAN